jgi:hypothetical protein
MDLRKFSAYVALAFWIGFTAITVNSMNEWSSEKLRLSEREEKSSDLQADMSKVHPTDLEASKELQGLAKNFHKNSGALIDDLTREHIMKHRLHVELASWFVLTLITCALWASPIALNLSLRE